MVSHDLLLLFAILDCRHTLSDIENVKMLPNLSLHDDRLLVAVFPALQCASKLRNLLITHSFEKMDATEQVLLVVAIAHYLQEGISGEAQSLYVGAACNRCRTRFRAQQRTLAKKAASCILLHFHPRVPFLSCAN